MKIRAIAFFASVMTVAAIAQQRPAPVIDTIRQADMKADLYFLGSDAMKGRLTNTPENRIASEWIKSRFERLGLAPAIPGYYQDYNLMTVTLGPTNALEVNGTPVAHGVGYVTQRFSATAEASGPVVFAGFGITARDMGYDDYASDIVKGAFVLVVDHEPGERDPASRFDGVVTSDVGGALRKAQAAQAHGAIGILYVSDVHNHPGGGANVTAGGAWPAQPSRLGTYSLETWMKSITIPAAQISAELAATLVKGSGRTLEDLSRSADTGKAITPVALPGAQVRLTTSVNRTAVPDRNVLAMIEGSDPQLKNEWVVVSAHFDHDGVNGTQIMNGADDDGSGTVAVLEIAEAYAAAAAQGQRPKRSVLFAQFNSEERGLLGAWAYTETPTVPLTNIVAVLNMDMIGRNEEVPAPAPPAAAGAAPQSGQGGRGGGGGRFNGLEPQTAESNANALNIIGGVRSPDLRTAINGANGGQKLEIRYRYDNNASQLMRRSDQWPFIQHGVPGVWVFTGLHLDYHTPQDRPERINYPKMEKVTRLVYQTSWDLANAASRPKLLPR
ncbi:MAG: M28 family peptidase [Acidobacteria bacterium]|nr:M28 family peptidase [Acidobacteriota bacterium]